MKELDKTKKYGLSKLNDEKLREIFHWLQKNDGWYGLKLSLFKEYIDKYCLYYHGNVKKWYFTTDMYNSTCATELFTDHIPEVEKKSEQATAYKETSNKLNYELDFNFITQMAERMAQNKHKYEPYNWQKLDNIEDLKQALLRHVLDVLKGNYKDDGREFAHLESIALNAMFINYQLNKNENNT